MVSTAFSKTTYAYFAEDRLREAARVFYLCLLCWNPADLLLTAVIWSPFFLKSNEPRVVNLEEYAKMYQPPELRPADKRDIPFVTT
ncbi:hypothetical protein AAVH_25423 [Aphelenchoides avenae]|nr:hypothetical protein AAVH_25423 [Aphelenchus avenae]